MIEEAKELMEDIKEKVGDKGFTVLTVCILAVGVYLVYRSFSSTSSEYAPTSVTGYPTVGENADEVMDSVNNTVEGAYNDISGMIGSRFDYIDGVLDNIQNDIGNSTEQIIQNSNQNTSSVIQNSNQNTTSIIQNSNQNKQEIQQVVEEVKQITSQVTNTDNATQTVTATKTTTATPKTTTTKSNNTYTYTTKAGLNTNTSIVDALKATGADSSFASRQAIAKANGISNYTGSYEQNVALLNKMKSGTLKKA